MPIGNTYRLRYSKEGYQTSYTQTFYVTGSLGSMRTLQEKDPEPPETTTRTLQVQLTSAGNWYTLGQGAMRVYEHWNTRDQRSQVCSNYDQKGGGTCTFEIEAGTPVRIQVTDVDEKWEFKRAVSSPNVCSMSAWSGRIGPSCEFTLTARTAVNARFCRDNDQQCKRTPLPPPPPPPPPP